MRQDAQRFHEIDLLRGFACASVVLFHFLVRGPKAGWIHGLDVPWAAAIWRYGYLGVHLFFVISGFVILMSAQGATARSFVASRVGRLYPALWVGATLTATVAWLANHQEFSVDPVTYLVNLTMAPHLFGVRYVDGAYWSLAYELHFYAFVWCTIRFGLIQRVEWVLFGWLLVSLVDAIRPAWPLQFWLCAQWAPFFAAGALFYRIRTEGVSSARLLLLAGAAGLAFNNVLRDAQGTRLDSLVLLAIVTAIFGTFWLIATKRLAVGPSKIAVIAGALTYPVYLIHQFFGMIVFEWIRGTTASAPLAFVGTLTLIVGISWLIYSRVERRVGPKLRRALEGSRSRGPSHLAGPSG